MYEIIAHIGMNTFVCVSCVNTTKKRQSTWDGWDFFLPTDHLIFMPGSVIKLIFLDKSKMGCLKCISQMYPWQTLGLFRMSGRGINASFFVTNPYFGETRCYGANSVPAHWDVAVGFGCVLCYISRAGGRTIAENDWGHTGKTISLSAVCIPFSSTHESLLREACGIQPCRFPPPKYQL